MASLGSYFVKDEKQLIPDSKFMIRGKFYRFSLLTPRLIRIEYNKDGTFENRATALVINRKFEDFRYNTGTQESNLIIKTEYFTLTYTKESPIAANTLKITINGTNNEWYPGSKEIKNVGTINYSLDDLTDTLNLSKGLYSMDGFAVIDDSNNPALENGLFVPRNKATDIYVFAYNRDLGLCLQDYYNLTGYPPMIPRYALGSWWYKNDVYNMYDIDNILKKFNENRIPISVFLLGNKWHSENEPFSYNRNLFDLSALNSYYGSKKQVFGLTINPELPITNNNPLYGELAKYSKASNKERLTFFPLSNETLSIYLNQIVSPLLSTGIKIFNIDYYNPNDKIGLFLLNHYHYIISSLNERGVILSRNPGIAPHRYPIIYSGKTKVSWNTLKNLPTYNNVAANIGVCWQAHAIGGYYGGSENEELYLRYIQFGVFNPIFILAGDTGKYYKREPWKWNESKLTIIKNYMQLRNKLVPYIYNEGYQYHKYGVPMIQPLYYKYPKIYDEPEHVNQYFFGSSIMISPIIKKKNNEINRVIQYIFIPKGIWYDYFSGKKYVGNKYYRVFYKDEDYPIFIKEGSIIPMSLDMDTNCPKNMEIQIFPAENGLFGSYELYEDDGISLINDKDNYIITKMNLDKVDNGYKFTINKKEGNFKLPKRNYYLRFRNMKTPEKVIVKYNNNIIENKYEIEKNDLIVIIKDVKVSESVEVNIIGKDIEIETLSVINEEIEGILDDLDIKTSLKDQIDGIIFSNSSIDTKKIELRKMKKFGLEPKFIDAFISLIEFIDAK